MPAMAFPYNPANGFSAQFLISIGYYEDILLPELPAFALF